MSVVEQVRAHAPLLATAIPLCAAALVFLMSNARAAWLAASIAAIAAAAAALDTGLAGAWSGGPASPLLAPDGVGLAGAALIACAAALCIISNGAVFAGSKAKEASYACALWLCLGGGWIGALLARDFVGVFLASECAWLACAGIVALGGDRAAIHGALRMLSIGGLSAVLFLLGMGLTTASTGALELAALPLARVTAADSASTGAALMVLALAAKAGLAPLHLWLAPAMGRTPPQTALACVVCVGGALALIVRLAAFAAPAPAIGSGASAALAALGALSIVVGSLQAIGAGNINRLVGYSGVAQAGIVMLSAALGSPAGTAAALIQIAAMTAGALALLGGAAASSSGRRLTGLDGLARRAPFSGIAITLGALSLMGAPLTLSFLGRWRLIEAAVGVEWWWAALLVIGASLAGVIYAGRLIERLYFRRAAAVAGVERAPWRLVLAPALVASVFVIALGVEPSAVLRAAAAAAHSLTGAGP